MPISKAKIKLINTLKQKKYRQKEGLFLVEGEKNVAELINNSQFKIKSIYAENQWIEANRLQLNINHLVEEISPKQLKQISNLSTPNQVLAIVEIPKIQSNNDSTMGLSLVLDDIRDPGNMGTIIRIADWFGISSIFCSPTCVDIYNSKVVQSTMGSLFRVNIHITDLEDLFEKHSDTPIFGAVMDGQNLFKTKTVADGFIIIGNESRGISNEIQKYITQNITIPAFGKAESLNAAVATGIICSYFKQNS